jgi:hypothetical protein
MKSSSRSILTLRGQNAAARLQLRNFQTPILGIFRVPITPGAEQVLRSEAGLLLTDKHELRSLWILPFDGEFVTVTAIQ